MQGWPVAEPRKGLFRWSPDGVERNLRIGFPLEMGNHPYIRVLICYDGHLFYYICRDYPQTYVHKTQNKYICPTLFSCRRG